MSADDIRRQWVDAVLEGRFATAEYLAPDLPPASTDDLRAVPDDSRDGYALAGEIGAS